MTRERFRRYVGQALETIPRRFRDHLKNVAVIVEDEPPPEVLAEMEVEPPDTLFGLYHGTPLTSRPWDFGNALPDRITIYQHPIEDACETDDEVVATIGETLIHEVGHFFGLSEEEIEEIEDRYWRGRFPDDEARSDE
jgi:predicted Zn-dependent protease with MMP-like domain